jgi:uracil-DNA glycosylase
MTNNSPRANPPLATLHDQMRDCQRCLNEGHAIIPGAVFSGDGGADVLLIGQAPGVTEVEAKRPFNASSGRRLFQWLGEAGFDEADFRQRQYMTAVTKCYPGKGNGGKGDRVPSKAEQAFCRPFLDRELEAVQPRLIILVGGLAIKLLYPAKWKLTKVIGTAVYHPTIASDPFDWQAGELLHGFDEVQNGRYIIPLPHPSGASLWPNKAENKALIARAVAMLELLRVRIDG